MDHRAKILVVEDDIEINEAVCRYLKKHEFEVFSVTRTKQAKHFVRRVDLIILDLQLPDGNGLELLQSIREEDDVPVIIMSAKGTGNHRIVGLELGADDYMAKPVIPRELLARVNAVLKRFQGQSKRSPVQTVKLDRKARLAVVGDKEVALSPQEFEIMATLSQSPGTTFSRQELMDLVWGHGNQSDTRKVDLMVSRVRTKFSDRGLDCGINSVRGVGYRFSLRD